MALFAFSRCTKSVLNDIQVYFGVLLATWKRGASVSLHLHPNQNNIVVTAQRASTGAKIQKSFFFCSSSAKHHFAYPVSISLNTLLEG